MTRFGCIDVVAVNGAALAAVDWPAPPGQMSNELLGNFEQLVHWIEDEKPCDALVLRLEPAATQPTKALRSPLPAAAELPDLEQCRKWEKLLVCVDRLPCVSIAVVDGMCVRFWMQLALACDHRVASSAARFQVRELKEGYLPGMNIFRLAKYVGIGVARRLVFTGDTLDASAAAALGIVDVIGESDVLEQSCHGLLERLRPIHPVPVQLARRLLNESFSATFEQFVGQYLASQYRCLSAAEREPVLEVP